MKRAAAALDDIDRAIIEQLQEDGRLPYTRLGQAVGLSEAAVRQRVQRLIDSGVMQVVAVTDPLSLGLRRMAMIGLRTEGDVSAIAEKVCGLTDVDYVVVTAGSFDIVIEVVVEDDAALLELIGRVRSIPGVRSTESFIYLRLAKQTYALGRALDDGPIDGARRTLAAREAPATSRSEPRASAATPMPSHQGGPVLTVGVPKETKTAEGRVAMTPDGVRELDRHGVAVFLEAGAGEGASITDGEFAAAGATIVPTAADAWGQQLVVKVKEPQGTELSMLREDLTLFTYLHLAAYPEVAKALLAARTTGIAYETVQLPSGALPLLAPMSEVAGRLAPQAGAYFLEAHKGGRGVLLGGAPGVRPARVVVLGAGNVGWNAAWIAAGMEAEVILLDKNLDRLRWVDQIHKGRIMTLASNQGAVERTLAEADLVIGAVLVAGGRAPVVVTEQMVAAMKRGAVIVDVAVDQGGCIETTRETTHNDPVYEVSGVIHYAVGNMPGAVPHTSTYALTNATLPYILDVARLGAEAACRADPALALGCNTVAGQVTNAPVADFLGLPFADPLSALSGA